MAAIPEKLPSSNANQVKKSIPKALNFAKAVSEIASVLQLELLHQPKPKGFGFSKIGICKLSKQSQSSAKANDQKKPTPKAIGLCSPFWHRWQLSTDSVRMDQNFTADRNATL